jgi:hypothetical protein
MNVRLIIIGLTIINPNNLISCILLGFISINITLKLRLIMIVNL